MKQIRIRCWFQKSEEFIAKLVIAKGYKIVIRKIIDPITIVAGKGYLTGEQYDIVGKDEEVDKLIEYLETGDYDIDIEEEQV
jgi:hypothetical protein